MHYLTNGYEKGLSLIETIVGLAIISIVAVVFITGLATSFKGKMVQDKGAFGQAIAVSQMEYVKTQPFSTNEWSYSVSTTNRSSTQQPSWWDDNNPPQLKDDYDRYYAVLAAEDFDADGDSLLEVPGDDDSVREITITVYNTADEEQFSLTAYKANK